MKERIPTAWRRAMIEAWRANHHYRYQIYGFIKPRPGGEFTLTCYGVNETARYGLRITAINRAWSDRPYYVCKDIWKNCWGSTLIEFHEEQSTRPDYARYRGRWGARIKWAEGDDWWMGYTHYLNLDALAQTKYKYCAYAVYEANNPACLSLSLIQYIRLYSEYPQVETLAKVGLYRFIQGRFLAKMSKNKGLAHYFRSVAASLTEYEGHRYDPADIVRAYRHGIALACAHELNRISRLYRKCPKGIDRIKLDRYLSANGIDRWDYYHYADLLTSAGHDICAFGNTFPRNFHKRERQIVAIIKRRKTIARKADTKRLEQVALIVNELLVRMHERLAWRLGEYEIIVPTTQKQFTKEGLAMRNCIGSYYDSCADGSTACFFIHRNGKPYVDCEIDPRTGSLRQCRAFGNQDASQETRDIASIVSKNVVKAIKSVGKKNKAA